jgi:hypothetical protein
MSLFVRTRRLWRSLSLLLLLPLLAGCPGIAPRSGRGAKVSAFSVHGYLREAELARPEIVEAVSVALREGRTYRERIRDQRNRWCLATVWIDNNRVLHVQTKRNETCPKCGGSGKRQWDNSTMQNLPFDTRCLKCDGKGYLPNHVKERRYVLSTEDYADPEAARRAMRNTAYRDAPPQAREYVRDLASDNPETRLAACRWLDRHYIRVGEPFQKFLPMLRKARWRETNERMKRGVYQFWAGRGEPSLSDVAYYRVYVDTGSGEIIEKGFYPEE